MKLVGIIRKTVFKGSSLEVLGVIEIALRHWCSPVSLLHILKISFPKRTSEGPLLRIAVCKFWK